ncbi:hypothetical protein DMH01_30560 [Amycolatopsis sp. WAC 04182]|nr:hypothetical protein DMH01_30560 [Amycolatopsis sp. WAC 04182]
MKAPFIALDAVKGAFTYFRGRSRIRRCCESHFRNLQRCESGFRNTSRQEKAPIPRGWGPFPYQSDLREAAA